MLLGVLYDRIHTVYGNFSIFAVSILYIKFFSTMLLSAFKGIDEAILTTSAPSVVTNGR